MRKIIQCVFATMMTIFGTLMLTSCDNNDSATVNSNSVFDASKYALVDLHLHLDGSLSVDDAIYMSSVEGVSLPASRSEIENMLVCPVDCESLTDYLKCFDLPVSILNKEQAKLMV